MRVSGSSASYRTVRLDESTTDMLSGEHDHSPEGIRERLSGGPAHSYLRDWLYGGIDGGVTTFAIVAGAAGGELGHRVTIILGLANLLADGFSMAASNFSGTRAEVEELKRMRGIEARHIAENPEGEREEIRQIYARKGFHGEGLESVVSTISSDQQRWIDTMLAEEYGLARDIRSPWRAAVTTFAAFVTCGAVPLLPFMFGWRNPLMPSVIMTVLVFAVVGALRSQWSAGRWWAAALETTALGSAAAGLAYFLAVTLRQWFAI